ncbi:MAG TPA: hypothetical protein VEL82_01190 [Thermoplasmata archaeon]|nr:hypothetical protein [Thermoplasmata archaeon]
MSPFRGSDEALDREIAAVEGIVRVRVRRTGAELRALDRDLRELRRERARRRSAGDEAIATQDAAGASARA